MLTFTYHRCSFVVESLEMTVPMPPRPPKPPSSVVEQSFMASPFNSSGEAKNASAIPLIVGFLLLLISVGLVVFSNVNAWLESDSRENLLHILGYLLTPIGVVLCLAWDMVTQRVGMHDINFFPKIKFTKALRLLTVTSFGVAWFHIEPIAKSIAESLAS